VVSREGSLALVHLCLLFRAEPLLTPQLSSHPQLLGFPVVPFIPALKLLDLVGNIMTRRVPGNPMAGLDPFGLGDY
jgi:hypothetical protein